MAIRLKYNKETDDVEFVNDKDEAVDSVGPDVVASWVAFYNEKHGYVKPEVVETSTEVKTEEEGSGTTNESEETKED